MDNQRSWCTNLEANALEFCYFDKLTKRIGWVTLFQQKIVVLVYLEAGYVFHNLLTLYFARFLFSFRLSVLLLHPFIYNCGGPVLIAPLLLFIYFLQEDDPASFRGAAARSVRCADDSLDLSAPASFPLPTPSPVSAHRYFAPMDHSIR